MISMNYAVIKLYYSCYYFANLFRCANAIPLFISAQGKLCYKLYTNVMQNTIINIIINYVQTSISRV